MLSCCSIHAAAVTHMTYMLITHGSMPETLIDKTVLFSSLFSAMGHDFEHEGLNNDFLIKTHHPYALRYNDQSPLENHHSAAACALAWDPEYQFVPV